nr:integrase arm-type DNA-binding domain-containing protein [Hephaestia sp. MAHUQ-44]
MNDAKLRAARPKDKAYKLTDSNRLYLYVTPAGGKLWRWNYSYDGRQKSLSFGSYPSTSLLEAREKRDAARKQLNEGIDPAIAKKLHIQANIEAARVTFEKVAREWHEANAPQWAKVHAAEVIRTLERDVFPAIGSLPIGALTPPKILEVLRAIEARSAIETAKRIRQRISAIYAYAIASGHTETDPAEKVGAALKPLPRKGRQPAITDISELRRMLATVDGDFARPVTRLALRLIALTAVRPGELRGALWSEFEDLDGSEPLWRIPASRMKGDRDRKDELGGDHLVPLAPESVAVLRTAWKLSGTGKLVFPSNRHLHRPMSENALGYLLNRAGYHGRHVPHGFRAAFSTIMNEWAKVHGRPDDREVIDLMLAHVPTNKVEGAYNRAAYMDRRRELAVVWAEMVSQSLLKPADLLPLPVKANPFKGVKRRTDPTPRPRLVE